MEIILSLAAGLVYGAADFCGGLATKKTAAIAVVVVSQASGLVLLLIVLPFLHGTTVASDYVWGACAGVGGGIGIALLYHALSIGRMGVISPVTAIVAAIMPVVVSSVRGDHLVWSQWLGIAIAFVAIVLISSSAEPTGEREISTAGVREAIFAGIAIGVFLVCLANTHHEAGIHNLVAARITSIAVLVLVGLATRASLIPAKPEMPLIVFTGAIDMAANALYVLATLYGTLSIAAVLTSLYPAGTVFLARVVLGERLSIAQKFGVAFALAGVLLIAWHL